MTIVIFDDHNLVAEMWSELINSDERFSVVAICNDTTDASIELVKTKRPDFVIMDINIQPTKAYPIMLEFVRQTNFVFSINL